MDSTLAVNQQALVMLQAARDQFAATMAEELELMREATAKRLPQGVDKVRRLRAATHHNRTRVHAGEKNSEESLVPSSCTNVL